MVAWEKGLTEERFLRTSCICAISEESIFMGAIKVIAVQMECAEIDNQSLILIGVAVTTGSLLSQ